MKYLLVFSSFVLIWAVKFFSLRRALKSGCLNAVYFKRSFILMRINEKIHAANRGDFENINMSLSMNSASSGFIMISSQYPMNIPEAPSLIPQPFSLANPENLSRTGDSPS